MEYGRVRLVMILMHQLVKKSLRRHNRKPKIPRTRTRVFRDFWLLLGLRVRITMRLVVLVRSVAVLGI
uniref:Uncharacterized protein At2g28910 n=1 Tax=Arabidopsis thaliana TaxID=3702 RepID=Q93XZ9_ARATH|nr:Unknown protein [Arabidopsis thaliana]AAM13290.1 unknown protein [Arabidopsis thaliana]